MSGQLRSTIASPLAGHLLGTADNDFVIAEWQDAGGTSAQPRLIAPFHLHHHDDEAWYVLEGALRVRVGDQEVETRAGSGGIGAALHAAHLLESGTRKASLPVGDDF